MPIKDPSIYPPDWLEIRKSILARAHDRCECEGECGRTHRPYGFGSRRCGKMNRRVYWKMVGPCRFPRPVRIVLTLAHLDHDASAGNHTHDNLKAMCQQCHLAFDREPNRVKRTGQPRLVPV